MKLTLNLVTLIVVIIPIVLALPPSAKNVYVQPYNSTLGNDLECSFNYTDPQNYTEQNSNFQWWKNSANQNISSRVLGRNNLSLGDSLFCKITPFNGLEYGSQNQSLNNVTIASTIKNSNFYIDQVKIWNFTDYYGEKQFLYGFEEKLQQAVDACIPDAQGFCNLSLTFTSEDTGSLNVTNLEIYYKTFTRPAIVLQGPVNDTVFVPENKKILINFTALDNSTNPFTVELYGRNSTENTTKMESFWTDIHDTSYSSQAEGITTDRDNNIIVTGICLGCSNGDPFNMDIYTYKLDSDGNLMWEKLNNKTIIDRPHGVAVDSSSSVYVAAQCTGCGGNGSDAFYTFKVNASGDQQWESIVDPSPSVDYPGDISVDTEDNIIVGGHCNYCLQQSYIIKYFPNGTIRWTKNFNPYSSGDSIDAIATDSSNNIYLTGSCSSGCGTPTDAPYIQKMNGSGTVIWSKVYDVSASSDYFLDIDIDNSDDVYVTGYCTNCGDRGGTAIYVMKVFSNGTQAWNTTNDPTSTSIDEGLGIAADNESNVYVTGQCNGCGNVGGYAIYNIMLLPNGTVVYSNVSDYAGGQDYGSAIDADNSNNVIIAGYCNSCSLSGSAFYTAKFDPATRPTPYELLYFNDSIFNNQTIVYNWSSINNYGAYSWYVNVSNQGFRTKSETRSLHLRNITLPIQLEFPANNSIFINARFNLTLNVSAVSSVPSNITVQIFGANQSNISQEWLLYYNDSVPNATVVSYNWTAPVIRSDSNSLVGLWHMDNRDEYGENATHLYDFSGNNNNGTANGSRLSTHGKFGRGYHFDGDDDFISVVNDSSLDLTQNFSISLWFNMVAPSNLYYTAFISKRYTDSSEDWWLAYHPPGTIYFKKGEVGLLVTWFAYFSLNNWHHLVMTTQNGINHTLYIDGINYGTVTHPYSIPVGDPVYIGAIRSYQIYYEFNGSMDEIALWNRTLSESEVRDLYRLGEGTYHWNVKASDSITTSQSETRQFFVRKDLLHVNIVNLSVVYANTSERVFRFDIVNNASTWLWDVDWQLNTTDGLVEAMYVTDIPASKDLIVYAYYNFSSGGVYNITATAFTLDAAKTASIEITV